MADYSRLSEGELVLLLKKGDQLAFSAIYDQYRRKVYSVSLRMLGLPELAEEVMQEVMLKLWQVGPGLNDDTSLDGYLKTLTRNRSYNVLRRLDLEAKAERSMARDYSDADNQTEEGILLKDTRRVLQQGIELLPGQQKLVYKMCYQQGLKYEQVARELNLSPLTVATHMKLALRFLREYVGKHTDVAAILVIFKLLEK